MNYTYVHNSFSKPSLRIFASSTHDAKHANGIAMSMCSLMQNYTRHASSTNYPAMGHHVFENKQIIK